MRLSAAGLLVAAWTALSACSRDPVASERRLDPAAPDDVDSTEPIRRVRAPKRPPEALVALGARLFRDPILSRDGSVACASCHDLEAGGDDGRPRSIGIDGQVGFVNAPSVFNAALNPSQFWDGRAESLEAQIDGPVQADREMGSDWADVEKRLRASAEYQAAFRSAFGAEPSRALVKQAIAAFETTLITVDSPFDRWLAGDDTALGKEQREGYQLFKDMGCVACHQGQNAGGNMYERLGLFGDYFEDRGNVEPADYGRYNVTRREEDRFVFRVPSLRDVESTAPYFHDGSASTLPEAVRVMARYQLGKELPDADRDRLVAFLKSLTGRRPDVLASSALGARP